MKKKYLLVAGVLLLIRVGLHTLFAAPLQDGVIKEVLTILFDVPLGFWLTITIPSIVYGIDLFDVIGLVILDKIEGFQE